MSVDETLMCSFQILKPADKKKNMGYGAFGGMGAGAGRGNQPVGNDRPTTPPKK